MFVGHSLCREPAFCGAERSAWWELTALAAHAHPSVAAMAKSMLAGTNVSYQGDPLRDLTLTAFLDKFMQKKPKVIDANFSWFCDHLCTCYSSKQVLNISADE